MEKYIDNKTVGQFTINDKTYFGELAISDSDAKLTLYLSEKPKDITNKFPTLIHGTLYDLTQVTLIDAYYLGLGGYNRQNTDGSYKKSFFLSFDLHYIIFGDSLLDEHRKNIKTLDFTLENSNDLLLTNSFGFIIHNKKDIAKKLLSEDTVQSKVRYGFEEDVDKYHIGGNPEIFVYTGNHILHEFKLPNGKLKFKNNIKMDLPSNNGFTVINHISCSVDFDTPYTFWESRIKVEPIKQLLVLIMGKNQSINTYNIEVLDTNNNSQSLQVYEDYRNKDSSKIIIPLPNRLIHIETEPDEFEKILNNWLEREQEWKFARNDFFSVFGQHIYNTDVLIKVANLFDIIPDSAYDKREPLSDEVSEAKSICHKLFKDLPRSIERESMLGALGRVGKKSLKHKIRDRYKIIKNSGFIDLHDIDCVIKQSVDCRNFFVHGGNPKFDYLNNFNIICFFIDTLLFIYGISEMIDAGWSSKQWKPDELNQHPYSIYIINYHHNLASLKNMVQLEQK